MNEKLRVTGGIVLGSRSNRPMAVAEEPDEEIVFSDPVVTYSAIPQICGFPWRTSVDGIFSIGPLTGPQTGILATEITTALKLDGNGARIYLREHYTESVASDGGYYVWSGRVVDGTSEIVVRSYSDTTNENVLPYLDGFGYATPATIMWQIAIVKYYEGQYYLCITLNPPDNGVPSAKVFPTEFDTANPL